MKQPKVGVGVLIIRKDGKLLLSKRKGSHGAGEYSFTGGHLEYGESFEECARRETREEAGIELKNIRFLYLASMKHYKNHYVDIGLIADYSSGTPKVMEPKKSGEWAWYDFDDLPEPLFEPCRLAVDAYLQKRNYYDS